MHTGTLALFLPLRNARVTRRYWVREGGGQVVRKPESSAGGTKGKGGVGRSERKASRPPAPPSGIPVHPFFTLGGAEGTAHGVKGLAAKRNLGLLSRTHGGEREVTPPGHPMTLAPHPTQHTHTQSKI